MLTFNSTCAAEGDRIICRMYGQMLVLLVCSIDLKRSSSDRKKPRFASSTVIQRRKHFMQSMAKTESNGDDSTLPTACRFRA